MANEAKYSDWLRIDLHIHTDWSKKTKENDYKGIFSVATLKQKMIENKVQIFSLTDHNIINIDAYKEYYASYDPANDPLLLVGVELDILVVGPTDSKTYHSLLIFNYNNIELATEIYNKLEEKYKQNGVEDKKRSLKIDEIVALFPEDDFFFIPHAGNTKSIIDAYKRVNIVEAQQMVLLMQSAFEKVQEKARKIYNDGFNNVLHEAFKNKDDHAYIEFSDNHNIEKYPCIGKGDDNTMHEFYYVKGGKNFETLRLAFIDQESRIKSTEQINQINKLHNYIEKIRISGNDTLPDNEITLSPHLNVLIGGRSSGKSLMMSILGEKLDCVVVNKEKYGKVKYDSIQIKSKLDANFQDSTSFSKEEVIFIRQGDIVKYFEENRLEDLAKESNRHVEYNSSKEQFKHHKASLDVLIESAVLKYNVVRDLDITKKCILHQATLEQILNKNYILKFDSRSLRESIQQTNSNLDEGSNSVGILEGEIKKIKENIVFEFSKDEVDLIASFENLLLAKKRLLEKKGATTSKKAKFIDEIDAVIQLKNQQLSADAQSKVEANAMRDKLITDIGQRFGSLSLLKQSCDSLNNFDYGLKQSILINEGVTLVLEIEKKNNIDKLVIDSISAGDLNVSFYLNLLNLLRGSTTFKNYSDNKTESFRKKIAKHLEEINEKFNNPKDYLDYDNGNTSKNNSPGFNSEKYLEIILSNPKTKLILIDQPEDNLGNKFIATNLVTLFRRIKFSKQVILVTHNPSVVVYGDAENVIVAENEENKIKYKQVVLENENYQKEICDILDGGEYIFNMRFKKYNIQKILKNV